MADGSRKRIADIRAGDVVLAKNEQTGKVEAQTVLATVNHSAAMESLFLLAGTTA